MNRALLVGAGACVILAGGLALYGLTQSPLLIALTVVGLLSFLIFLLIGDPIARRPPSNDVPEDASVIDLSGIKPRHVASLVVPLLILWVFSIGNYQLGVLLTVLSVVFVIGWQAYKRNWFILG